MAIRVTVSGVTKEDKDKNDTAVQLTALTFENKTPTYQAQCAAAENAVLLFLSDEPVTIEYSVVNGSKKGSKTGPPEKIQLKMGSNLKNYWLFYAPPGKFTVTVKSTDPQKGFSFTVKEVLDGGVLMPTDGTIQHAYVVEVTPQQEAGKAQPKAVGKKGATFTR